eukprot:Gb_01575 [translate_table: standard]
MRRKGDEGGGHRRDKEGRRERGRGREAPACEEVTDRKGAGTCLGLVAITIGCEIVPFIMPCVQENISKPDWRCREARTCAFGFFLEGPSPEKLLSLVIMALNFMLNAMKDENNQVKDTTAWTLGPRSLRAMLQEGPGEREGDASSILSEVKEEGGEAFTVNDFVTGLQITVPYARRRGNTERTRSRNLRGRSLTIGGDWRRIFLRQIDFFSTAREDAGAYRLKEEVRESVLIDDFDSQATRNELLESRVGDTLMASANQRGRLLMSSERVNQSSEQIKESKRTLMEIEDLGVSILQDLHLKL